MGAFRIELIDVEERRMQRSRADLRETIKYRDF